jgi:hypothetical protein
MMGVFGLAASIGLLKLRQTTIRNADRFPSAMAAHMLMPAMRR